MKVQELRIGNYVKAKYEDESSDDYVDVICEIDGIDGCGFSEHMYWLHPIEGESREEYYEVGPIPLTEQWLIDFGFEISSFYEMYSHKELKLRYYGFYLDKNDNDFVLKYDMDEYLIGLEPMIKIKYVHQLQNLYYALTGKELTK